MINNFESQGYCLINSSHLRDRMAEIKFVFEKNYLSKFTEDPIFNRQIIKLLTNDVLVKSFYLSDEIINEIKKTGIRYPISAGPIVSHYTGRDLTGGGYGLGFHQDYPSMAGSKNSVIVWSSIYDTNPNTHGISVVPSSHKSGLHPGAQTDKGYLVDRVDQSNARFIHLRAGDILLMSSYLLHATYINPEAKAPKLSLSARFDDFESQEWQKRGYISAYSTAVDRNAYLK